MKPNLLFFLLLAFFYPRDASAQTETKFSASDGKDGDNFGRSIVVDGDNAIIGAPFGDSGNRINTGAAYIFEKQGSDWMEVAKLIAKGGELLDFFGWSVSIDKDIALVGAYKTDERGAAYVFERQGDDWTEVSKLTADDSSNDDGFGVSVAISGTYVIIGSSGDDTGGLNAGSAYIFERQDGQWNQIIRLTSSDPKQNEFFGSSVVIQENYAFVGATGSGGLGLGCVYVFHRDEGEWVEVDKLVSSDAAQNDQFGAFLSIEGDELIIGANLDDDKEQASGSAYVFQLEEAGWIEKNKLVAYDGAEEDLFGTSVAVNDDVVAVGSHQDDDNGDKSGSAYIYQRRGSAWELATKLTASDGVANDQFGYAVALHENEVLVGAWRSANDGIHTGSVYVYDLIVAPQIVSQAITEIVVGGSYAYKVEATGAPAPTFSLEIAPSGMVIDPVSGLIEWAPNQLGDFDITVAVSNDVDPSDTQSFVLSVIGGTAPMITSIPETAATVNQAYSYDVEAAGFPLPTFQLNAQPEAMVIDSNTGLIEWVPIEPGDFDVTVVALNGIVPADTQRYVVNVAGIAPVIMSTPDTTIQVFQTYSYNVEASGIPASTYGLAQAPEGMTIDSLTGVVEWTPNDLGVFDIQIVAKNGTAPADSQQFALTVNGIAPSITSAPGLSAYLNKEYTYDVEATGFPPAVFDLTITPEGMLIDSLTGLIEWTPIELGRFVVWIGASNGVVPADSQAYAIIVGALSPLIVSSPDTLAMVDELYTYDVEALGTPAPKYNLTVFPEGMVMDSTTGLLEWTPATPGDFDITIVASNGNVPPDSQDYTITVTGIAPVISSIPDTIGIVGHLYTYEVEAMGNPVPWFSLTANPEGMVIDSLTGLIEWTPIEPGAFEVNVESKNGVVPSASQSYRIMIADNVSNELEEGIPDIFEVKTNYPNPFMTSTTIEFSLPESVGMKIVVYDVLGRSLEVLFEGVKPAGRHRLIWEAEPSLPEGLYLLQVKTNKGDRHIITIMKL